MVAASILKIQSHVFEPFYTTRAEGSGLGLAVADSVLRSHGGQITLASSNEQGSTFLIRTADCQQQ